MKNVSGSSLREFMFAVVVCLLLAGQVARADFVFGEPTNFGPTVNSPAIDSVPNISADGLSLIFLSNRSGTSGPADIWVATRVTTEENWGAPVPLANVNSSGEESWLHVSADGLSLYFCDQFVGNQPRPGGHGQSDIWVSIRATASDPWGQPENLSPPVNTWSNEGCPFIWDDGCTLLFSSDRAGGSGNWDMWVATRETKSDEWNTPVPLANVNSSGHDLRPAMSPDGLLLFFVRGTWSAADIWMASRRSAEEPFGFPVKVPEPINYWHHNSGPSFSADGSTLYFNSNRPGGSGSYDLWQASILPVVDLNSDGIVDCADMCIMVDYWGTDEPPCDIGPLPWGDGIVDVQDLIVLAEHLFEVYPSAETVEVNEDNDGGQIELELDKLLVVTLASNPSTGYRWEPVADNESILKQFGEVEFKPSETGYPPLVGAGGWEIFRFKAVSAGQIPLKLVYRRPWEEGVEPVKTISIEVVVR